MGKKLISIAIKVFRKESSQLHVQGTITADITTYTIKHVITRWGTLIFEINRIVIKI